MHSYCITFGMDEYILLYVYSNGGCGVVGVGRDEVRMGVIQRLASSYLTSMKLHTFKGDLCYKTCRSRAAKTLLHM